MNRLQAIEKDKKGNFYEEFDDDSGMWGVFGTESGFCYKTCGSEHEAKHVAEQMEKENKKKQGAIFGNIEKVAEFVKSLD